MRVLTMRQPWAWAIIHGGKDVENRTRNIAGSYRGPVAIHAGLAAIEMQDVASVIKIVGRSAWVAARGPQPKGRTVASSVWSTSSTFTLAGSGKTTTASERQHQASQK